VGIREIPGAVSTGVQNKIQPWQALFAIFTYALTQFDLGETNTLILLGIVMTGLGFVMRSTYLHKQATKEIVAPWLLEQVIKILSDYLPAPLPPSEVAPVIVDEPTREELIAQLEALGVKE
jgi:hypothetical protein